MPESFPQRELSCLRLHGFRAKQLWEGNKFLPNLRMIYLERLWNLIKTPNFDGLPNLERFMVYKCSRLEEIHPSFGSLEKLVYVKIEECYDLKMLPPIPRSKELNTLLLPRFIQFYKLLKIPRNMKNFLSHNIWLWFYGGCLRKLDLSRCNMRDGDIRSSAVWVLPNLEKLNLEGNRFVRLNFSLMQLPRIQYLNISYCTELVELSELPSSIAVVIADGCSSLETLGDFSNCKWLWKVSLLGENKLGQLGGDILLHSMLQGDSRDYFISMSLSNSDIWRGFVPWVDWVKTLTVPLPHDWYNDYSGLLMFVKCHEYWQQGFKIVISQGVHLNFQCEPGQESNEALDTSALMTYVGYVSFSSLRHTGCLKSTYNLISFSLNDEIGWISADPRWWEACRLRAVLVPKHDLMQTTKVATDCSEFWEDEIYGRKTFTVQHDSNSSIKIYWKHLPWIDPFSLFSDNVW